MKLFFFKINSIYPLPVSGRAGRMRWPVCPLLYRPRLRCHSCQGTRFQTPVTAWTPGDPNVWYSSPVFHVPSPLASSHHPEWTIGIQGSTIRDLTRWKIRHVLICKWSRRTCAITCSGYHRQAENQKTYQNNGFDDRLIHGSPDGGFLSSVLFIHFRGRNCREYNTDLPG